MSAPQRQPEISVVGRLVEMAHDLRHRTDWQILTIFAVIGLGAFGMFLLLIAMEESRLGR